MPEGLQSVRYAEDETVLAQPTDDEVLEKLAISGTSISRSDADRNLLWSAEAGGACECDAESEVVTGADGLWEVQREGDTVSIAAGHMEFAREGTNNVVFRDDVTIKALDDFEFTAGEATYQAGTEKIICSGGVSWSHRGYFASAENLVFDQRAQKIRMTDGVRISNR